jgi:hypothetical protein
LIVYLCQENVVNASLRANGMESKIFCSFFKFQNSIFLNIVIMSDLVAALRPLFKESLEPTIANNTTKVNIEVRLWKILVL